MTQRILEDPTRRELRDAFERFGEVETLLVSRWYPQARLYNWVYRYGWKASIRREGDYWRVTRTGGEGRQIGAHAPIQAQIREKLDRLVVGGVLDGEGFTQEQAVRAGLLFADKKFKVVEFADGWGIERTD